MASGTFVDPQALEFYSWITAFNNQEVLWSKKIKSDTILNIAHASAEQLNGSHDVIVSVHESQLNTDSMCYELMRLDSATGNLVWSKKVNFDFGTGIFTYYKNALQITDQNEILVTYSINEYLYAAKFTENGNLIFSKKINNIFGAAFNNPGFSFIETSDGGYLGTLTNENNPTLIKLNADFSTAWSKYWSIETYSRPKAAIELSNGKFAISGLGDLGYFIAVLDTNGTIESYKVIAADMTAAYGLIELQQADSNTLVGAGIRSYFSYDFTTGIFSESLSPMNRNYAFDLSNGIHFYEYSPNLIEINKALFNMNFDLNSPDCNPFEQTNYSSQDVFITPEQVIDNPPFYIEDQGELVNYTPNLESLPVTLNLDCYLATKEITAPSVELSPNPVSSGELLTVQLENIPAENKYIELTDVSGNVIMRFPIEQSTVEMTIPPLAAGLYFIRTGHSTSQKLMVN
ncbi:MAG: hypothetical protein A3D31_05370 [Candidatus Fluviicola riflensis]|nr:MAG: hypothetical protein A3D31_05370 [Candidatus Fluviicola riflensis]OGS86832.1 MAG: hypothetical protein A2724_04830 [Fluviicola sp. RIFCSPHIGHO2_01_FULL_43_53]OGS89622.1 MAG: hypothetical protein A3E30_01575 [Fluviicola sp. RIFCSPHIGHO2_12_FULL_43_24]